MKKLLISFAALALLAACSDDDNDENNGQQPSLLTKQITKIERTETEEDGQVYEDSWEYDYNSDGKIIAVTSYGNTDFTVTYNGNKVTEKDGDDTSEYTLENGRVSTCTYTAEHEDESYTSEYRYNDGYLSKITETGEGYVSTSTFSFKNGCLEKSELTWVEDEDEPYTEAYEFTYTTKRPNNLNVDIFGWITDIDGCERIMILGIAGNRSAYLPDVMKYTEDGDTDIYNFKYDVDADGYITKITQTCGSEKTEYVITYKN